MNIKNSSFNYNNAFNVGAKGGAISAILESTVNISSSSFTNNNSDRNGGAVHADDAQIITVDSSYFNNNRVVGAVLPDGSGGGIGTNRTNLKVSTSLFENNFSGPIAGGGAIFFHIPFDDGQAYTLNVTGSIFNNNNAASIGGGGIAVLGINPHTGSKGTISSSIFNNNVGGVGGALYLDGVPLVVKDSVFTGNDAWTNGGAVFVSNLGDASFGVSALADRPIVSISNSVFIGNTLVGVPLSAFVTPAQIFNIVAGFFTNGGSFVTNMFAGGGAISSEFAGSLTIAKSSFLYNKATGGNGGAVLVGGGLGSPLGINQANVKLSQSTCIGNTDLVNHRNNTAILDPAGLGNIPEGVFLDNTDGSCR